MFLPPFFFFSLFLLYLLGEQSAGSIDTAGFNDFHQALTDQAHNLIYLFMFHFYFPVHNVTRFGFVTNLNRELFVSSLLPQYPIVPLKLAVLK